MSNWGHLQDKAYQTSQQDRINVRGKDLNVYANSFIRLREDKLRSMKRALFNSYQAAIIQFDKDDRNYYFRCLINHDKLKVDYEDKILSIPFRQVPVDLEASELSISEKMVDTGTPGRFLDEMGVPVLDQEGKEIYQYRVRPGDTFKWISGNQGYMPNSYWIITTQYSEETAYFRGEIRKADDEIEIIPIGQDGEQEDPVIYHGWTTGPNQDQAIWNVKKGVVWNDMFWTKILYITKDQTTSAFFNRFDRVVINGQTFEVQTYNDNYGSSSSNMQGGLIRVALKETYTSTNQQIKELKQQQEKTSSSEDMIIGRNNIATYDIVTYSVNTSHGDWSFSENAPFKILKQTETELQISVLQVTKKGKYQINNGDLSLEVIVKPFA